MAGGNQGVSFRAEGNVNPSAFVIRDNFALASRQAENHSAGDVPLIRIAGRISSVENPAMTRKIVFVRHGGRGVSQ